VAWSLIGEWTCRVLFPPPKGSWPRCGHPCADYVALLQRFAQMLLTRHAGRKPVRGEKCGTKHVAGLRYFVVLKEVPEWPWQSGLRCNLHVQEVKSF